MSGVVHYTFVPVTVSFMRQHLVHTGSPAMRTLCGFTGAHDQSYIDRVYGGAYVVTGMPRCRRCDKTAKLLNSGRQ